MEEAEAIDAINELRRSSISRLPGELPPRSVAHFMQAFNGFVGRATKDLSTLYSLGYHLEEALAPPLEFLEEEIFCQLYASLHRHLGYFDNYLRAAEVEARTLRQRSGALQFTAPRSSGSAAR